MVLMKAIIFKDYGNASVLEINEVEKPLPNEDEVLIKVAGAGINRPDILQRSGLYPPPKGASEILGLEVSGVVVEVGNNIEKNMIGSEVCALLSGGGYAEYAKCHISTILPIPKGISLIDACTIPEAFFTVWTNLFDQAKLKEKEVLLIHGGASGIGLTALSIAKQLGVKCFATVGNDQKKEFIESQGLATCINYKYEDFEEKLKESNVRADVILDIVGGEYFEKNLNLLNKFGRLVNIAYLNGSIVKANLLPIMLKRLVVTGSTLRIRSNKEKEVIKNSLLENVWPLFEKKALNLYIDQKYDYLDVRNAHEYMESNQNIGKLLLKF